MPQRMTLIGDPTEEFSNNTNNSFKVRIPDGLRLEGQGWKIALLSLTLPNTDAGLIPFVSGTNNIVARTKWTSVHLKGLVDHRLTESTPYPASAGILATQVDGAINGVAYWNKLVQAHEAKVVDEVYELRKLLVAKDDPTPVVFMKETMCPSFRWEGEDLIIK